MSAAGHNVRVAVAFVLALVVPFPDPNTTFLIGLVAHNRPIGFRHAITSMKADTIAIL
jgi:hypothetical protein